MGRGVGIGKRCASCCLSARGDELVAVECAARRCDVMPRRPQGQIVGVLVDVAEFESVGVGGFQMPGDHLVGVESHARAARCHPVGESLVQVRAVRLEQPAIGDVADEDVVEAPYRLIADVGTARLGELEPTKSVRATA